MATQVPPNTIPRACQICAQLRSVRGLCTAPSPDLCGRVLFWKKMQAHLEHKPVTPTPRIF